MLWTQDEDEDFFLKEVGYKIVKFC